MESAVIQNHGGVFTVKFKYIRLGEAITTGWNDTAQNWKLLYKNLWNW